MKLQLENKPARVCVVFKGVGRSLPALLVQSVVTHVGEIEKDFEKLLFQKRTKEGSCISRFLPCG